MLFDTYKDIDTFITPRNSGIFDVKFKGKLHSFYFWKKIEHKKRGVIWKDYTIYKPVYVLENSQGHILYTALDIKSFRKKIKEYFRKQGFKEKELSVIKKFQESQISKDLFSRQNELVPKKVRDFLTEIINQYNIRPRYKVAPEKEGEKEMYEWNSGGFFLLWDASSYNRLSLIWDNYLVFSRNIKSLITEPSFVIGLTLLLQTLKKEKLEQVIIIDWIITVSKIREILDNMTLDEVIVFIEDLEYVRHL